MFKNVEYYENINLKNLSTMKTGGVGRWLVCPKNINELVQVLEICDKMKINHFMLGNGSNVLFDDAGFDGALISLRNFNQFVREGNCVQVGAGMNLFALNLKLQSAGLSGLEFSFGIPAMLGGFVVMNGGCFGHEICEFVKSVTVLNQNTVMTLQRKDICFGYRFSSLKNLIVLGVELELKPEKSEIIQQKMQDFLETKHRMQPCDLPSLGSVFKRVSGEENVYPAKLIDNLGLKGVKIGGAEVSKKHAGFIVNTGDATSEDVLDLIRFLEARLAEVGVHVEREIVVINKFGDEK